MEPPLTVPASISIRADTPADRWQAVVIGAGPAGCVAATLLARAGVATLLIERCRLPRDKVCGCCLAPLGAHTLQELGLAHVLQGASTIHTVRLCAHGHSLALASPASVVLSRTQLDGALACAAQQAGADMLWPASATVLPDDRVQLRAATLDGPLTLRPRVVLIADGLAGHSADARPALAWRAATARAARIGVGAQLAPFPGAPAPGELLMAVGARGYAGLVRLPGGQLDLAAAIDPRWCKHDGGPAPACAHILREAGVPIDARALQACTFAGTPTLTRARRALADGRVLVVGDAAGYVEPFTGEGMSWAIAGARACVPHALHAIEHGCAPQWSLAHARLLGTRMRACALHARMVRWPRALGAALALGALVPGVRRAFAGISRHVGAPAPLVPS